MLDVFKKFADFLTSLFGLSVDTHFGSAVHFFIEDITKIFFLIYILIFVISLFRSQLSPERVRDYLQGKPKYIGYLLAVILGAITPFCSCSSIPLFIGFLSAGIPFGISMAFLISSPLISEIAVILLLGMDGIGVSVAVIYIISGVVIASIGGYLADLFKLDRYLKYTPPIVKQPNLSSSRKSVRIKAIINYANSFALETIKNIWIYIVIGLLIGAVMHGYVPQEFFIKYLGKENLFAVPLASIIGAPIYASHAGVVPIIQVFIMKGVPIGTSLVMLMSITAISIPELIMLSRVLKWKMIAIFVIYLIISFIITGYLINFLI